MMLINAVLITAGMLLLIKGGDLLVNGASSLARRYKISELAIGLTIVALGTSAPEFVVSFVANINSHPEIALGNVIGSNILNLLLILGVTGLILPVAVQKNTVRIEIPFSLFAALLLFLLGNLSLLPGSKNMLSRIDGLVLFLFFCLFIFYTFKYVKKENGSDTGNPSTPFSLIKTILFIVIGLAMLIVGGRVVVNAAVELAEALGISQKIISITIVAAGTSLPELVTSITAIIKKKSDIAIGNIIGSNIFNILFVLGTCALVKPMEFSQIFNRDLYLLFLSTLILFVSMFTGKKRKIDRWEAAIFVVFYIGYVIALLKWSI